MDFYCIEEKITKFIEEEFPKYTRKELPKIDSFIDDFLDLDTYKKNVQVFFEFNEWNFDYLSNHSHNQEINLKIYVVCRNGKSIELKKYCQDYTTDFYRFFDEVGNNLNGIVDFGKIETVTFYDAVQGDVGIKISEINIKLNLEV